MAAGKKWTRDELLIALNFYHKLTFGQLHARQPVVVALAGKLGRGANSVAMKLCNLASLDPALQLRGIKGLQGASALDRATWEEFHADLNETVPASEQAVRALFAADEDSAFEVIPKKGVRIRRRSARWIDRGFRHGETAARPGVFQGCRDQQQRRTLQCNGSGRARATCGLAHFAVGLASRHRLDVRNGLSLSRLHDAAFDCGLITFDAGLRMLLSPRLKRELPQRAVAKTLRLRIGVAPFSRRRRLA